MHGGVNLARRPKWLKFPCWEFKFASIQIFAHSSDKGALAQLWNTIFIGRYSLASGSLICTMAAHDGIIRYR